MSNKIQIFNNLELANLNSKTPIFRSSYVESLYFESNEKCIINFRHNMKQLFIYVHLFI